MCMIFNPQSTMLQCVFHLLSRTTQNSNIQLRTQHLFVNYALMNLIISMSANFLRWGHSSTQTNCPRYQLSICGNKNLTGVQDNSMHVRNVTSASELYNGKRVRVYTPYSMTHASLTMSTHVTTISSYECGRPAGQVLAHDYTNIVCDKQCDVISIVTQKCLPTV